MARRKSSTAQPAAAKQSPAPPAVAPPTTTVAPVTPMIVGGPSGMPQGNSHVTSPASDPSAVSALTLKPAPSSALEDNQQGNLRSSNKAPMVIVPPRPPAGASDAIEIDAGHPAPCRPALPAGTLIEVSVKRPASVSASTPAPRAGGCGRARRSNHGSPLFLPVDAETGAVRGSCVADRAAAEDRGAI